MADDDGIQPKRDRTSLQFFYTLIGSTNVKDTNVFVKGNERGRIRNHLVLAYFWKWSGHWPASKKKSGSGRI